ncbi:methyl-accepting chemotaxis protein [Iodobacter fluviatilis]|uniref:H1 n=1 Tax=Iodobacter fluviatilis TaxID=537 RepID=A0A377SVN2_9NEIS|nr:methyl-accepting chemotaxis protein [Iodobacter fluviatilis]TCU85495.1 methyl-accepting chemotaxis protein [Iodobacter fluviatilis]STR45057.1 H1 [Iodobacter fluviatilis]
MSLKFRLFLMGLSGVAAVLIMGFIGLNGQNSSRNSVEDLLGGLSVLRNQMEADMMHDAIRGDVLSAILAIKNNDLKEVDSAEKDLAEHGKHFKELFASNEKLVQGEQIKNKITTVKPVVDAYIALATQLFTSAKNAPEKMEKDLPIFQQQFDVLEKEMAALSDLIEKQSAEQSKGSEEVFEKSQLHMLVFLVLVIIAMTLVSTLVTKQISAVLSEAIAIARNIAHGDFCHDIETSRKDEMGQLLLSLRAMQSHLESIIRQVSDSAEEVICYGQELAAQSGLIRAASENQNASAGAIAESIGQMVVSIEQVNSSAQRAHSLTAESAGLSNDGAKMIAGVLAGMEEVEKSVSETSDIIHGLGERSDQINSIVNVIKEIADQTNLLALNAAIEAARAGEQGRGFAVVADEVRTLAHRTTQATQEIGSVINGILQGTRDAIESMERGVQRVKNGNEQARAVALVVQQSSTGSGDVIESVIDIATAMQEQNKGSDVISRGIEQIVAMSGENVEATQRAVDTTARLNELALKMKGLISQFKLHALKAG